MAFDITATLRVVQSALLKGGYFKGGVQIGEPKAPPGTRFTAAVSMVSVSIPGTVLNALEEVHVVNLRIYDNMMREPQEDVELEMAIVLSDVMNDLAGDFDLGATVRAIDFAGMYGTSMGARLGYLDVGGTMYRVVDLTVPLILITGATLAA